MLGIDQRRLTPAPAISVAGISRGGLTSPVVALDTNSQAIRIPAICNSDYVAISLREFVRRVARTYRLVELPVKALSHARRLSLVYRKDGYLSPAARRLMNLLKLGARQIGEKHHSVHAPPRR